MFRVCCVSVCMVSMCVGRVRSFPPCGCVVGHIAVPSRPSRRVHHRIALRAPLLYARSVDLQRLRSRRVGCHSDWAACSTSRNCMRIAKTNVMASAVSRAHTSAEAAIHNSNNALALLLSPPLGSPSSVGVVLMRSGAPRRLSRGRLMSGSGPVCVMSFFISLSCCALRLSVRC